MGQPGIPHPGQVTLYIRCLRCGNVETRVQGFFSHHRVDRGDHPHRYAGCPQDVINQVGGGGFAVRAGYTNHNHVT